MIAAKDIKASIRHETEPEALVAGKDPYPDWLNRDPRGMLVVAEGIMADVNYEDDDWDNRYVYLPANELEAFHKSGSFIGGFADIQHRGQDSRVGEIIGLKMDTVTITVDGNEVEKPVLLTAIDVTEHGAKEDILGGHYNGISAYWNYIPEHKQDGLVHATKLFYNGLLGAVSFVYNPQANLGIRHFWKPE